MYIPCVGRNCGVRVLVLEENIVAEYYIKVAIYRILRENTTRGEAEDKMNGKGEEKIENVMLCSLFVLSCAVAG